MTKYIIKNCPAYSVCGICVSQEAECLCQNCTDCLLKQIVEKCKEKIIFCKNCSKNADIDIDCVECDERGEAHFAQCILNNFLEIEEVND